MSKYSFLPSRFSLLLVAGAVAQATGAWAQIRTDASLGRPAQSLAGPNFLIPEALGRLAGRNLFHSFQSFNIGSGESATFTTTTPNLANVVSRVTGGTPSQINGLLSLQASNAAPNFFFINPAGVTFGAGGAIDVPGAFHVSTAQYLQFPDGVFSADANAASTFSSAPPEAFGFLGGARAAVQVRDGGLIITRPGQALSVVAGDVDVSGRSIVGKFGGAGELRVVAAGADAVKVPLTGAVPEVHGQVTVSGESAIRSATQDASDAGRLLVAAGSLALSDGGQLSSFTAAAGKGAAIEVEVAGKLAVGNAALLDSLATATGDAGAIRVQAGEIAIEGQGEAFTGITSTTFRTATGRAGDVQVQAAGTLSIGNGLIRSVTSSGGDGGNVSVSARNIVLDGQGTVGGAISTSTFAGSLGKAGTLQVAAQEHLQVLNGAIIDSSTSSGADAGLVQVSAGRITIDGQATGYAGITGSASSGSTGKGGGIDVRTTGALRLANGGQIDSSTYSSGQGGSVRIEAGSMAIEGRGDAPLSSAVYAVSMPTASGNAGDIDITVHGALTLVGQASIDSSVYTAGDGGAVKIRAGSLELDGLNLLGTGIRSRSHAAAGYKPGRLDLTVQGQLAVRNGGLIDSSTYGGVEAGGVNVSAGSLLIDGGSSELLTGIFSSAGFGSTGHGGAIDVKVAGLLSIFTYGEIDSTTYSVGHAGTVRVQAGDILIDDRGSTGYLTGIFSEATRSSSGNAGAVDVTARGKLSIVNGGSIGSNAYSTGHAGAIKVLAGDIVIDGQAFGRTGILSGALPESGGDAGSIEVAATGDLFMTNNGLIESATRSLGSAGSVKVSARTVRVDGEHTSINAAAAEGSRGQTGSVLVQAGERIELSNGGRLSIQSDATVADPARVTPGSLVAEAPDIVIGKGSKITAQAAGNVAASNLEVRFGERLALDGGSITTSANDGNGGAIRVAGGQLITMRGAQITTSVQGLTGNGGNIDVQATALVLDNGFIQANTAAENATGGDVHIDVRALVPSGTSLFLGGQASYAFDPAVFGFNVIQAAAPTGVSGAVQISSPALDVAGSLAGLQVPALAAAELARSPCEPGGRSSLFLAGQGGFAPSAREFLGLDGSVAGPAAALGPPPAAPPGTVLAASRMRSPQCAR